MNKLWTWLKGLFLTTKSPAQVALDYKLEADIMAKRNQLAMAYEKVIIAHNAYLILRSRKKRSEPARQAHVAARSECLRLEMEIRDLEKRRG